MLNRYFLYYFFPNTTQPVLYHSYRTLDEAQNVGQNKFGKFSYVLDSETLQLYNTDILS